MGSPVSQPDAKHRDALLAQADEELAKLAEEAARYASGKGRLEQPTSSGSGAIELNPRQVDVAKEERPSLSRRASRSLKHFLLAFLIGVATTLGWQSYSDLAKERLAAYFPELGWLQPVKARSPQAAPYAAGTGNPASSQVPTSETEPGQSPANDTTAQIAAPVEANFSPEILRNLRTISDEIAKLGQIGHDIAELKAAVERLAVAQKTIGNNLEKAQEAQERNRRRTAAQPARPTSSSQRRPEPMQAQSSESPRPATPGPLPAPSPRPPMPLVR